MIKVEQILLQTDKSFYQKWKKVLPKINGKQ